MLTSIRADRFRRRLIFAGTVDPEKTLDQFRGKNVVDLFSAIANQTKEQRADTNRAVLASLGEGGTLYDALKKAIQIITSTIKGLQGGKPAITAAIGDEPRKYDQSFSEIRNKKLKDSVINKPKRNFEAVIKEADWNSIITFILVASICLGLWWYADSTYGPDKIEDVNQGSVKDFIDGIRRFFVSNGDHLLEQGAKFISGIRNIL